MNGTVLLECGLRVLACMAVENQKDEMKRFRCVRGLAVNALCGWHWGDMP